PAGNHACQDERLIVGLAAAVDEKALGQITRRDAGERIGEGDALGGQKLRRDAARLVRLTPDRIDHGAIAVAQIAVEELREKIKITAGLAVVEIDAFATLELRQFVLALLHGPRQEQMLAWRSDCGHSKSPGPSGEQE